MAIVNVIDQHDGFAIITGLIRTRSLSDLLWLISLGTFFLAPLIGNLTVTIVMISLVRQLVPEPRQRLPFSALVIIAANAGGAWSPIGDVTTTMLWLGGQISTLGVVKDVFLASLTCVLVPLLLLGWRLRGPALGAAGGEGAPSPVAPWERRLVFLVGILAPVTAPLFKAVTRLPPVMGMLLGLAVVWTLTELMHRGKEPSRRDALSVSTALTRVDLTTILFFLGILLCIAALEEGGHLLALSHALERVFRGLIPVGISLGLVSAIVDNVPLVAATQGMYPLPQYPLDHFLWSFFVYCIGTGGSVLIIGSAAGVAVMSIEKIDFMTYARRFALPALLGYLAGAGVYILQYRLLHGAG